MPQTNKDMDEAALTLATERGVITAIEAESFRSAVQRKRASLNADMTMLEYLHHAGSITKSEFDEFCAVLDGRPIPKTTPAPSASISQSAKAATPSPVEVPDESPDVTLDLPAAINNTPDETDEPTRARDRRPTDTLMDPPAARSDRRPTDTLMDPPQNLRPTDTLTDPPSRKQDPRPTDTLMDPPTPVTQKASNSTPVERETSNIEKESDRRDTGKPTKKRSKNRKHTDLIGGGTDQVVPAGTIIQLSEMTIADIRANVGIKDDGVKLLSDKMDSSIAHMQHGAEENKKRYVVIREIARGGMGKVLEVEDTELKRSVALKVLRKELLGRRDVVERFLEEAQITGQLEHPNIVPVHEMGVDGAGNLYFTMKFVEGGSLAETLQTLREGNRDKLLEYPLTRRLDIFVRICEAISFAHNRGVIHRDLKPANIMVGTYGEVQVMDWGVAKVIGREAWKEKTTKVVVTDRMAQGTSHTMVGSVIGTPSYMSPEQAKGDIENTGHHTDMFSLGVILYELLCLRSPWTGKRAEEVLEQVREMTPMKPSERNPSVEVPAELERLALRCLEKEPEQRLQSVRELAENIRAYINGRAMGAVEYSAVKLASKWISRNRKGVIAVTAVVLAIAASIVGTVWFFEEQKRQEILGLSEDANVIMQEWEPLSDKGDYDAAVAKLDEAKDLYQRVLVVDEQDESALEGLKTVSNGYAEVRKDRLASEREHATFVRHKELLSDARNALNASQAEDHVLMAQDSLLKALENTATVLREDPESVEARRLRAEAAYEFASKALKARRFDLCELMLDVLHSTGELRTKYAELRQEFIRLKP